VIFAAKRGEGLAVASLIPFELALAAEKSLIGVVASSSSIEL